MSPGGTITRLRIVLAHHYQRVDPSQVWTIAAEEPPAVVEALSGLNNYSSRVHRAGAYVRAYPWSITHRL